MFLKCEHLVVRTGEQQMIKTLLTLLSRNAPRRSSLSGVCKNNIIMTNLHKFPPFCQLILFRILTVYWNAFKMKMYSRPLSCPSKVWLKDLPHDPTMRSSRINEKSSAEIASHSATSLVVVQFAYMQILLA